MNVIVNFYWFLYRLFKHRNDKKIFVDNDIYNQRVSKCLACDNLYEKGLLVKIKGPRCGICKCFIQYKTMFHFEECPDLNNKKW